VGGVARFFTYLRTLICLSVRGCGVIESLLQPQDAAT
jgi:hypothetical protein